MTIRPWRVCRAMNAGDRVDELIRRNHALLWRAAATRAYSSLVFDEAAETVLMAYVAKLRARDLLRRRRVAVLLNFGAT